MKGLYLSLDHSISDLSYCALESTDNGIIKKIINQFLCLKSSGFDMEMYCPYAKRSRKFHAVVRRLPFSGSISFGKSIIDKANSFSFVFARSPWFMNYDLVLFFRNLKKANPGIKIVLEVPTVVDSYGEVNKLHMLPLVLKNKHALKKISKYVDRIFTFSKRDFVYGVKTINSFNAINPNYIKRIDHKNGDPKRINLIACSSLAFWHGYDRAIEGLKEYYDSNPNPPYQIFLYIVGDGEELNKYIAMVRKYDLAEKVVICGKKSGASLDELYNLADIALDSMGRHRSHVFYNSSLKGKEYCAKGLPIISGVETELDQRTDFPFYMRIPADDTSLKMDDVIAFFEKIYNSGMSKKEVVDQISTFAAGNFSYEASLRPLIDYILHDKN